MPRRHRAAPAPAPGRRPSNTGGRTARPTASPATSPARRRELPRTGAPAPVELIGARNAPRATAAREGAGRRGHIAERTEDRGRGPVARSALAHPLETAAARHSAPGAGPGGRSYLLTSS